jgi:transcription initiation factor IIF auxiliary subunit
MTSPIHIPPQLLGYAADPAIEMLLPKDMLAQIKIRKIDSAIKEYQSAIDLLNMQRDMLAKEYKVTK